MRRLAKAMSAFTPGRSGSADGRDARSFAGRGLSLGADGSGAPSAGRRTATSALAAAFLAFAALAAFAPAAPAAEAPPQELGEFCLKGTAAGQCEGPRGMIADPETGHIYVAEVNTRRISVFTSWGIFVKAFGWDVAPGAVNEQQEVRVRAGAGQFTLGFGASSTADLEHDSTAEEVEAALNGLASISAGGGSVSVDGGPGAASGAASSPYVVSFDGGPLAGTDAVPLTAADGTTPLGGGAPSTDLNVRTRADGHASTTGIETCTTESGCKAGLSGAGGGQLSNAFGLARDSAGDIYVVDQTNRRIQKFSPEGRFLRAWGWDVVSAGPGQSDEIQTIAVKATAGQFTLTFGAETTADIEYNASPATVETELNALGTINAGGGSVSVLGGPGDETGSVPYAITFDGGPLAGANVAQLTSANGTTPLSGGNPASGATVTTTNPGATGFEVCVAADGDTCKIGVAGTGQGQFGAWQVGAFLAIDSADVVYVGDNNRIQKFAASGAFVSEIPRPGEGFVKHLAIDSAGDLYTVSQNASTLVRKLDSSGAEICTVGGELEGGGAVPTAPTALAVDVDDNLYVVDGASNPKILKFDSGCGPLLTNWAGDGSFTASTTIATNVIGDGTDTPGDVYVANSLAASTLARIFGAPPEFELAPPAAPVIAAQYAVTVDTDSARVRADINPRFWADTSYHVEYGTEECSLGPEACEGRVPLVGENTLGAGVVDEATATDDVFLQGLEPETTYFYRFLVQSGGGGPVAGDTHSFTTPPLPAGPQADCANQAFRTGASAFLPNCRAFEMVSPIDKAGGELRTRQPIFGNYNRPNLSAHEQSSGDGEALTYSSARAFGDAVGAPYVSQYLARRDPEQGWLTHGISPPRVNFPGMIRQQLDSEYQFFSEDLSEAWLVHDAEPPLGGCAPLDSTTLYRRDNVSESYEPLHCEPMGIDARGSFPTQVQGISADRCRTVFRSRGKLTADANPLPPGEGTPFQLYESSCEGPTRLVGKLPGGANCAQISSAGTEDIGFNGPARASRVRHAFSADGHRLYWTCGSTLYLRTDPDLDVEGDEEVIQVLAGAAFEAASPDGSRALLLVSGGLRVYDAQADTLTPIAGGVKGSLLGASDDARRAYFASTEVLPESGQNSEGDEAEPGANNLYFYEESEAGPQFVFVGALAPKEIPPAGGSASSDRQPSPLHPSPLLHAARVSADGLYAAFISAASLTGYDNTDLGHGNPSAEVFLFDATASGGAGETLCASCNPTGARPASGRNIASTATGNGNEIWAAAHIPGWTTQLGPGPRPLSEDGSRLFFESFEALIPRDTNGRQDVYQWQRASDKAECEALGAELFVQQASGCLSLISSGQDPDDTFFVDADNDGDNVFIRTGESLVPWDPGSIDIYDARKGGGLPPPASPKPGCGGEACQSPPAPPVFQTPSSSSASGPGNPSATKPRCNRRQIRRGNRCIAKRALARRACAKREGKAKQRCLRNRMQRLNRAQQRQNRQATTSRRAGR